MIDRIKQLMDFKGMTAAVFADTIKVNRSSLTHIFTGRNQPSLELVRKILTAFPEVKPEWLVMGMGDMLGGTAETIEAAALQEKMPKSNAAENTFPVTLDLFADEEMSEVQQPSSAVPVEETKQLPSVSQVEATEPMPSYPTSVVSGRKGSTKNKTDISGKITQEVQKNDSRQVKNVKKIVFFYADNTFEVFCPTKKND